MKTIPLIAFLLTTTWSLADDKQHAEHAPFTPEQIAEHLGLAGGNWTVSFDEKLYCGFIISETSDDGILTKEYYWSSDASQNHQFHFMHHIESKNQRSESHSVSFSSLQEGEWQPSSESKTSKSKISFGKGIRYKTTLPNGGASTAQYRDNSVKITPEAPEILYRWESQKTKRTFSLEIIFTKNTSKAELDDNSES